MKKYIIKFYSFLIGLALLQGCGSDDGEGVGPLADLNALAGDWVDESVPKVTDDSGFIAFSFDATTSSAIIYAATSNDAEIMCNDLLFRNVIPVGDGTFNGEGLLSSGTTSDYIDVTLTLSGSTTLSVSWECSTCSPVVDELSKLVDRSEVVPVKISENINEETTLVNIVCDPDEPDYIITDYIEVRQPLEIESGVVIAFEANAGIHVREVNSNGSITAIGTSEDPIQFTGVEKTPGFWRGIAVQSNDVRNELNHVIVEYAGSDPIASFGGVNIKGGVAIEGITGFEGSLSIENTVIRQNDGYGLIVEKGTQLRSFADNEFNNNEEAAVRMDADNVGEVDGASDFVGSNGLDGVEINASGSGLHDVTQEATWPSLAGGAVYRVVQSFDVRARLTLEPGVTIEFEANETMYFKQDFSGPNDGIVIARGTASEPITFTGAVKTAGYWRGLVIQSNSVLNEIDNCIVEYGGSDVVAAGQLGNVIADRDGAFEPPILKVTNSIIRHSAGCGIVSEASSLDFGGTTFSDNVGLNVCL